MNTALVAYISIDAYILYDKAEQHYL
jgi:hypothetical protein